MNKLNVVSPEIFIHAEQFYNAYRKLGGDSLTTFPATMCLVFSIELFFKSLNAEVKYVRDDEKSNDCFEVDTISIKPKILDHNLLKLFNGLPDELKNNIEYDFFSKFKININDILTSESDNFVCIRYFFECDKKCNNVIRLSDLTNVADFMYEYLKNFDKNN